MGVFFGIAFYLLCFSSAFSFYIIAVLCGDYADADHYKIHDGKQNFCSSDGIPYYEFISVCNANVIK